MIAAARTPTDVVGPDDFQKLREVRFFQCTNSRDRYSRKFLDRARSFTYPAGDDAKKNIRFNEHVPRSNNIHPSTSISEQVRFYRVIAAPDVTNNSSSSFPAPGKRNTIAYRFTLSTLVYSRLKSTPFSRLLFV